MTMLTRTRAPLDRSKGRPGPRPNRRGDRLMATAKRFCMGVLLVQRRRPPSSP
jgi:hypothetical protein